MVMPTDDVLGDLPEPPAFPGKRPLKTMQEPNSVTPPEQDPEAWDTKPKMIWHKGAEREFFTIGHLARALGRRPVTIRSWESKGWLPMPRFRTPKPNAPQVPGKETKGKRLYTREQIEVVLAAADTAHIVLDERTQQQLDSIFAKRAENRSEKELRYVQAHQPDWKQFTRLIVAGWKALQ